MAVDQHILIKRYVPMHVRQDNYAGLFESENADAVLFRQQKVRIDNNPVFLHRLLHQCNKTTDVIVYLL